MSKNIDSIEGKIKTTSRGVGFFEHDSLDDVVRIEKEDLNTALNGDTVLVRIHPKTASSDIFGEVMKIIERGKKRFVGTVSVHNDNIIIDADDKRIYKKFSVQDSKVSLEPEDKVLAEFVEWKDEKTNPVAKVLKVIGKKGEHETEILSIVLDKGIRTTFPNDVEEEARSVKKDLGPITKSEISKRKDLRDTKTFTIDPLDAKDFDDAISIKYLNGGKYQIGVHIADVSHYVRPGTKLDKEALERGFSSYLVDRTIPMLPEILSNDLCSLNPNEDKLAYSAIFEINKDAKVINSWFGKSVIHSNNRFTYENAQESIDTDGNHSRELTTLNDIAKKFRDDRMKKGAIGFDSAEYKFELDQKGVPIKIYRKKQLDTNKLVEEFMLLANKEVATFINKSQGNPEPKKAKPFIYRIHDLPDPEKVEELSIFIKAMGYELKLKNGKVSGIALNKLFEDITGTSEESLIKTAAIRSMAKAAYSTKNVGHFGLGFGFYTHFTSPIRRYADLLVHRLLSKCLLGEHISAGENANFSRIADQLSSKEISTVEAGRDSIKLKQIEYMSKHIGEKIDGVITGVTEFGLFVADQKTGSEGLIHIKKLEDDYYILDSKNYQLVGQKRKRKFRLGDSLKVVVDRVNLDRKELDYRLP